MCTSIPDRYRLLLCSRRTARGAPSPAVQLKRWAIAAALIAALLGPVMASSADAGTYTINNCPAAMAGDYDVGPWTQFGTLTAPGSFKQTCVTANDWFGIASNGIPSNATAGEELLSPPSITMQHIKLWWEAPAPVSGGGWSYALVDVYSPGWSRVFQSTTPLSADGAGKTAPTELSLPANTTKVNVEIYCTNSENCTYGEDPLQISGSQITLLDSSMPKGTVTGGGLAGAGPVSGSQSLAYEAEDSGSGVRLVELLVDGQAVAKNDYLAECPYENFAACPTSVSSLISWNTAGVSDGSHEVALRVVNAAGNSLIVDDHTVAIDNQPVQTSSGSLTGSPAHIANGDPCAGVELGLEVNGQRGAPVIPYGRTVTVTGVLHCGTVAIRDAQVAIATVGGAASAAIDSTVQTGLDGSFSYTVPAGPDRSLQFSYTAYSDDPGPSASVIVMIAIRPRIKLRVGPRHTSNGRSIRWAGTIAGGPYPSQGVTLDVEVQEGRRWRIFDQVVANRKGQFHYSYRFHATVEATTYKFRVALPASGSGGYPYTPGASNTVAVHVNP